MPIYKHGGPVDCPEAFNVSNIRGRLAIVTGGANGLGEAYVRALHSAGCKVIIGDVNTEKGKSLEKELDGTKFVKCDTTHWEDQLEMFRTAASFAADGRVSYVVANAGIARADDVFSYSGDGQEPSKPDLSIADVNITGTLYTAKLAFHYFVKQNGTSPSPAQQDTCLVLIGSGAAFLDCPRAPQYAASKWAARGIMHSLRRTAHFYGSRVNVISPWYVRTTILTDEAFRNVAGAGVEFATVEDAGRCLLRIVGDEGVNGHSFFVCARKWAPESGYLDLGLDEYDSELVQEIQRDQLLSAPVEAGLFVDPYEGAKKGE